MWMFWEGQRGWLKVGTGGGDGCAKGRSKRIAGEGLEDISSVHLLVLAVGLVGGCDTGVVVKMVVRFSGALRFLHLWKG